MKILLSGVLLCLCLTLNAQFVEPEFGKIDMAEMTMTRYEKDTTAAALILFDNGNTEFRLDENNRFQFIFKRHCRIKIFKNKAFNLAEQSIELYQSEKGVKESLANLEARTYNLDEGKIVYTELDPNKIYEDEVKIKSSFYRNKKFAFPKVHEGSVIEFSYTITSNLLYNFRGWTFQCEYPAVWSQYHFIIPEYLVYRQAARGFLPFDINKTEQTNTFFTVHWVEPLPVGGMTNFGRDSNNPRTEYYQDNILTNETTLAVKDVPSFISEPNIDCAQNYLQAINFELSSVKYPREFRKDYTRTWESVNKELKEADFFGVVLNSSRFVKDTVDRLCANIPANYDKAVVIYDYVKNRMSWNGNYRLGSLDGLKKPFMKRSGNSAEINMLLIVMLREANLKANPVLFSTRDNGLAEPFYPTISKFNSILVSVKIDDKSYLLDATGQNCPFGVIPDNDINGKGRIIDDASGDWANLIAADRYRVFKSYNLNISPEGVFSGRVVGNCMGYAAVEFRNELSHEKTNDDYIRKLQEEIDGLSVNGYSISDKNNIYKPIVDTLNVEVSNRADIIGDKIMFKPLLWEAVRQNPYTLENRQYPIDFTYPKSENCSFSYTLPDGYMVESMPQSISMKLPDGSISFSYSIQSIDNKIQIGYKFNIGKSQFLPDEYKDLKDFYDQIVKKHAEQIILKKTI